MEALGGAVVILILAVALILFIDAALARSQLGRPGRMIIACTTLGFVAIFFFWSFWMAASW